MKGFGTKEITDEIVELDDLAKKKVPFSLSQIWFGGPRVMSSSKTKKNVCFFWTEKHCQKKRGFYPV